MPAENERGLQSKPLAEDARAWRSILRDVAGSAVLIAGFLYAVGCVIKLGQLQKAGIDGVGGLGLVPMQQLLLLGISKTMEIIVALVLIVGVATVLVPALERERPDEPQPIHEMKPGRLVAVLVFAVVLSAAVAPSWGVLAWFLTCIAGLVARWRRKIRGAVAVAALAAAGLGWLGLEQYIDPQSLPSVTISTRAPDFGVIRGPLIVHADGTWYVVQPKGQIRGIADDHAAWTRIDAPKQKESSGGFSNLFRAFR